MPIIRLRLLTAVGLGPANGGDKPAGEIVELDANDAIPMLQSRQADLEPPVGDTEMLLSDRLELAGYRVGHLIRKTLY